MSNKSPYKDTLLLPKTQFAMKANLTQREPEMLKNWEKESLYNKMRSIRIDKPEFILHDGPPYANGNIHHGHCLNKILKDICVKFRHMQGHHVDFVPGWDCHGLPIEHEVEKQEDISLLTSDRPTIRKRCRSYASKFVKLQKKQFMRLGILGDFDSPYLTMDPSYEAKDLEVLAAFVEKGMVYRRKKPVHWSIGGQTSLAGSEVEYKDVTDPAITVMCPIASGNTHLKDVLENTHALFWTTTPWSIPAVLGLSVHANFTYGIFDTSKGRILIATDRAEATSKEGEITLDKPLWTGTGEDLKGAQFVNPITQKDMPVLIGDHVTLDIGTGVVSTAPGHGEDDYKIGIANGLEVMCPVGPDGRFTDLAPAYVGLEVFEANPKIIADLKSKHALFALHKLKHSYPHCWRTKKPAVLRATEQWFIDFHSCGLKEFATAEAKKSNWIPDWSLSRIEGMLKNRPDWCISRQRAWGVPIPSLVCSDCHEETLSADVCKAVAEKFRESSADIWDKVPLEDLIPQKYLKCLSCDSTQVTKGTNILDVWFDSGISFAATVKERLGIDQADLYLEGNDQFRGWYQSSLLASYGYQDKAPYKAVLTHGMILDESGHKFSKSSKNYEPSETFVSKHGADVLRLWVSSENFKDDMTFSMENIKRVEDVYRKLRNTFRYMLGFVSAQGDYSEAPKVSHPLHQYMLHETQAWLDTIQKHYEAYEFNHVFRAFNTFFTVTLSNFYFDILKDSLYCDAKYSPFRKEALDILRYIAFWGSHMLAPICSFMAEDVYEHLPLTDKSKSIFLSPVTWPEHHVKTSNPSLNKSFTEILDIRNKVLAACEPLRNNKTIQSNTEAHITINGKIPHALETHAEELARYFNVAAVTLSHDESDGLTVSANKSAAEKCPRCWRLVESSPDSDLCVRCVEVVASLNNPTPV